MTFLVIVVSVIKLWWSLDHDQNQWNTCAYNYQFDMRQCARMYPDSTDIRRAVCEAEARGRYMGCLDSWQ